MKTDRQNMIERQINIKFQECSTIVSAAIYGTSDSIEEINKQPSHLLEKAARKAYKKATHYNILNDLLEFTMVGPFIGGGLLISALMSYIAESPASSVPLNFCIAGSTILSSQLIDISNSGKVLD